jgi:glyoxylase-like metal-dependent hydrolase (beta-lactamase superfamily II)
MAMTEHARFTIDADVVPRFTACYLRIAGDECAFVEAHTAHALPRLLAALAEHGKRPEDVRYVALTHAHLDHASGAGALMAACPNATLVAHARTAKHMIDPDKLVRGAKHVYGEARFAELYGEVKPIPAERVRGLKDGDSFELGGKKLTAFETYGHAFHHVIIDDPAIETVYTGDTFGLVYPALQRFGRFALPSTSPTGFDAAEAKKSLAKVLSLGERFVCPTHYGGYEDKAVIAAQVGRFVDRAGEWALEASRGDETPQAIEARFAGLWRRAIADEAPSFGEDEMKLLALDVELNAQGLAHAATSIREERRAAAT